jgi:N-acetylneuraminic acid mutarotase
LNEKNLPPSISHHTCNVYQGKMYLFGGSTGGKENINMYVLDLFKNQWSILKTKPKNGDDNNLPITRDEHSSFIYNDYMVIFGGFAFGERTNDIYKFHFKTNSWEKFILNEQPLP